MRIKLTTRVMDLYKQVFKSYEHVNLILIKGKFYLDNKPISYYKFKKDYYFMLGDNRNDSEDSRFFGLIPQEGITGKASLVFFSYNREFKWDRFMHLID